MPLVTQIPQSTDTSLEEVKVSIARHTLQKKHWRITAADGEDIAVELDKPCSHGDAVCETDRKRYIIDQLPEAVITVKIPDDSEQSAVLGWFIGNQHIPLEVKNNTIRIADEATVRQLLDRNHIHYHCEESIFCPNPHSKGAHHHDHHHHH
jgi:urease accessory protein UreE